MDNNELTEVNAKKTNLVFYIFCIWSFILLCRPQDYFTFLGVIRPSVTLGLITILIYALSAENNFSITNNSQFKLYVILIMLMIISVPFSLYKSASFKHVVHYTIITTTFFVLFYKLVNTMNKIKNILFLYCCGTTIYAIYVIIFGDFTDKRISYGSMFDPNDIVFFILSLYTFNFIFLSKENSNLKRIIAAINIIICLIVIMKTGSRGGLVAVLTVLAYLIFVKTTTIQISFINKLAIVFFAFVSLQLVSLNTTRYETIMNIENDYNIVGEEGRIAIWKIGMKLIMSNPFTGVGVSCFSEGVGRDREERGLASAKWQAPHNSLVQIGAEIGIFGLLVFCLMSYNVFRISNKVIISSQSKNLVKISEMAKVGFLGHFISSMFLSHAYSIYWAFYIVLSATLQLVYYNEYGSKKFND